jgi:hypothetical protein
MFIPAVPEGRPVQYFENDCRDSTPGCASLGLWFFIGQKTISKKLGQGVENWLFW